LNFSRLFVGGNWLWYLDFVKKRPFFFKLPPLTAMNIIMLDNSIAVIPCGASRDKGLATSSLTQPLFPLPSALQHCLTAHRWRQSGRSCIRRRWCPSRRMPMMAGRPSDCSASTERRGKWQGRWRRRQSGRTRGEGPGMRHSGSFCDGTSNIISKHYKETRFFR
jgi:hypothetical protein